MPGFLGEIAAGDLRKNFGKTLKEKLVKGKIEGKFYYLERRTNSKFLNDKIFKESENFIIITEGVILNRLDLIKKYKQNNFLDTVKEMYLQEGEQFFNEFRGSFSGIFYDKRKDKWVIYTSHIGDKQVFYCKLNNSIIFGSEINYLINYMNNNSYNYNLDIDAAYFLLTYGFMLEDYTLFKEIRKLNAGHYIKIQNNKFEVKEYYRLNNKPNEKQSEKDIIQNIDILFRNAVRAEFEKDIEYNYKHIAGLSGGLDSRMTTWVAHDLGYVDILNFTFSQSDYLDEKIAKKIASDLKHDFIFKALDNGEFLKDIEEVVGLSFGGALYYGLAHGKSCLDLINLDNFGLVHTGQLGDVILGTFFSSLNNQNQQTFKIGDGSYSKKLINRLNNIDLKYDYKNEEIFKFYGRGFTGANQGLLPIQEVTEATSPFYYLEFINYCLEIPLKYRYNHYIYFKWIKERYPNAANYKWEKIDAKITEPILNIMGRKIPLKHLPKKFFNKLRGKLGFGDNSMNTSFHMNPLDYWYNTNKNLKKFMDCYYKDNIKLLNSYSDLKKDCEKLYTIGNVTEKNQVLTLLSAIKIYFGEK
ncbi:asparagine synthase [Orenia metallireducens]|uniref:asparagine synthase (glutamine-hydrolyzing) n=1 Tax=Orenia metallireducens TaxID=1413210 RepID=A0A1C0A601_9FIRM|nr:asparagine synthase [Orenia metallireducens]OCL25570.1 asparagine synthase [Orenia metallireducens]